MELNQVIFVELSFISFYISYIWDIYSYITRVILFQYQRLKFLTHVITLKTAWKLDFETFCLYWLVRVCPHPLYIQKKAITKRYASCKYFSPQSSDWMNSIFRFYQLKFKYQLGRKWKHSLFITQRIWSITEIMPSHKKCRLAYFIPKDVKWICFSLLKST